ncbi:MAG TPA: cellulase family glycosylhydrolase [Myxococcales bacterium]|jgi:hypothetical protein
MGQRGPGLLATIFALAAAACTSQPPVAAPAPMTRLTVDRTYLRDAHGRYVFFQGVNVAGNTKVAEFEQVGFETKATFMNRPFPLSMADEEFELLRQKGFNSVRLLVVWEAIQPDGPDTFDETYLDYLRELVIAAGRHGLYVLLDMHQDMFSRHLFVKYTSQPKLGPPGSVEAAMLALVPREPGGEYDDRVQGDGAPKWALAACLPEKRIDSKWWGTPRLVSGLDAASAQKVVDFYTRFTGAPAAQTDAWKSIFLANLPGTFPVNETTDLMPFTGWAITHALSLDLARSYACLLAGDKAFPTVTAGGKNLKDYLQDAFAASWGKVAERVADLPNVMGYDVINEPGGNFIPLTAAAGFVRAGGPSGAQSALVNLLGAADGQLAYDALVALRVLPPDAKPETLAAYGLDKLDVMAVASMNNGFDQNYMRPLFERAGRAILAKDPRAVLFIENTLSALSLLGGGGEGAMFEVAMTHPEGIPQVVFAPHWYPDIYPMPGFNMPSRDFTGPQMRFRDYQPKLEEARGLAKHSLGNIPVVFGEFGTYWNYGGIERSRQTLYETSAYVLNDYYEAFDRLFQSNILWCYSYENSYRTGDGWNREDFSILDPAHAPRGELSWSRPHARALAGKPISRHFWSDYHYFDPQKGVVDPKREFEVRYASKETGAPTEISVPAAQYPEGFYVWISDGRCTWDPKTLTLYHQPTADDPGFEHFVRILPPDPAREALGWSYFFKGDQVVQKN